MLENLRRQGSSVFIYVIFGILIAMFVINFRPGGQKGDDAGCTGDSNTAISVDGSEVSRPSFLVPYGAFQGTARARTEQAFEMIIRREILAAEARRKGLIVSDTLIDDQIKQGMFFLAGERNKIEGLFQTNDNGTKTWSIRAFKNWVASTFNVSMSSFRDEQQREYQGQLMVQILGDEVRVSRDEALADYLYDHNTVTYDSVVFRPEAYRGAIRVSEDDAARFLATHEAEVKARWETDKATYEKVNPQIRVREIFIAKAETAAVTPDDKKPAEGSGAGSAAAGSGAGSASPAPKHDPLADAERADNQVLPDAKKPAAAAPKKPGLTIAEAKAKLDAAAADIKAGKKKFADVAMELSTDEAAKWNGGALGWRTTDAPALGAREVNDAVKTLKQGELTPVLVTDRGVYLVTVEGTRAGKLEYDAVKLELATAVAKDVWSREAALRDAVAANEKAHAGTGKNLDQIFEREAERPQMDDELQKILNDPSLTNKQKQDVLQQYIKMQQRHGSLILEGTDQPVAWYADPDGAGGGSAPAPAGRAAPVPAAGSAATIPAPPTPAPVSLTPSTDKLPAFATLEAPKVNKNGPTPKQPKLPGIGSSKAASDALFDELTPGMLGKTIYAADGNFVLVQLTEKQAAKMDEFDKDADHLVAELRQRRSSALVEDFLRTRCETLAKASRISWNKALLRETDKDGKPLAETYKPCQSFHRGEALGGGGGGGGGAVDVGAPDADE